MRLLVLRGERMSRIGQKPIEVPDGVGVSVAGAEVCVKGPRGELSRTLPPGISAVVESGLVRVCRADETKAQRALHGTNRSLIASMIEGVTNGFTKRLEIQGVGFRANVEGQTLSVTLGFAVPVEYTVPEGVLVQVQDNTKIEVTGMDKQKVGQVAARVRSFFPPEPYKGKGIRYEGEHVRRKAGKSVA